MPRTLVLSSRLWSWKAGKKDLQACYFYKYQGHSMYFHLSHLDLCYCTILWLHWRCISLFSLISSNSGMPSRFRAFLPQPVWSQLPPALCHQHPWDGQDERLQCILRWLCWNCLVCWDQHGKIGAFLKLLVNLWGSWCLSCNLIIVLKVITKC